MLNEDVPGASEPGNDTDTSTLSILLVEDDELVRENTAQMIEELGYEVLRAPDAEQAVALLKSRVFDVLMADINLPDMSGEVLAAEARALHPRIQIVFVTGRSDIRDPITHGLDPIVLRKPYDFAALGTVLRSLKTQS